MYSGVIDNDATLSKKEAKGYNCVLKCLVVKPFCLSS